jgi:hypothetical protein
MVYRHIPVNFEHCLRSILIVSSCHKYAFQVVYSLLGVGLQLCVHSWSHVCYVSRPAYRPWFNILNNTGEKYMLRSFYRVSQEPTMTACHSSRERTTGKWVSHNTEHRRLILVGGLRVGRYVALSEAQISAQNDVLGHPEAVHFPQNYRRQHESTQCKVRSVNVVYTSPG